MGAFFWLNLLIPTEALKFYSLVSLVSHLGHLCAAEGEQIWVIRMRETPFEHGLHYNFGHVWSMYRSSPFRSNLNTDPTWTRASHARFSTRWQKHLQYHFSAFVCIVFHVSYTLVNNSLSSGSISFPHQLHLRSLVSAALGIRQLVLKSHSTYMQHHGWKMSWQVCLFF